MRKPLNLDLMAAILTNYQSKTAKHPIFIPLSQCDEEYSGPDQIVYDDLDAQNPYGPKTWPLAPKEHEKLATAAFLAGLSIKHAYVHLLDGIWRLHIEFLGNKTEYTITEGKIFSRFLNAYSEH